MSNRVERFEAAGVVWRSTQLENGDVEIEPANGEPVLIVHEACGEVRVEAFRLHKTLRLPTTPDGLAVTVQIKRFATLPGALNMAARILANDPTMMSDAKMFQVRHAH